MAEEERPVSRGFQGRRVDAASHARVPPGQHVTRDFPVLSAGPTPHVQLSEWTFSMRAGNTVLGQWSWQDFNDLPQTRVTVDIHCVTKWSKLGTEWQGVTIDALLEAAGQPSPPTSHVMAHCDGGYT